jgi:vancomycin resistance protein YoaR
LREPEFDLTRTARRKQRGVRLPIIIAVGAIVALVVLAIVIDSAVYYNKIHAGVSVEGTSLSGSTRDEAIAELTETVEQTQKNTVTLTNGDKTWQLAPTEVGTAFDVEGAVAEAMDVSRKSNFLVDLGKRIKLYFSGVDIPLTGAIDSAKMDTYVKDLAAQIDIAPVDAGLKFESGKVVAVEGKNGTVVDQDKLKQDLETVLVSQHSTQVVIPLKEQQPAVQADDMQPAIDQANIMMGSPVTLTFKNKSWSISGTQIASYMDFTSEDVGGVSTLKPVLSAEKMKTFLESITDDVATKPKDATFKTDGKKAWVVDAVDGTTLDQAKTAEAITEASMQTSGRTTEAAVTTKEADLTTKEAEDMGIKDLLSSYTTPPYSGSSNRQHNVRITTEYASDVILAPGEVYNFDEQIGPRTAARGYKTAPGIVGPGKLEDVFGGGICQVSTTLFNAAFFAGLEIVERKNHSIYIDHYPKGRDATVSAGSPNLRFKNDTQHYILIKGASDGITTTFNIYGTSEGRKVTHTTSDFYNVVGRSTVTVKNPALGTGTTVVKTNGQSGKQCKVVRKITYADGTTKTDVFISTYPMVPRTVEVGTGSTSSTTTTTNPGSTTTTTQQPPSSTSTTEF